MRLIALLLLLNAQFLLATEQPYFRAVDGGRLDSLPLEFSEAKVAITHAIAEVQLKQRFGNRGDEPIEAIYVFPGASSAAVRGLTLSLGGRRIEAQIRERGAAVVTYEKAKSAGQTASILQQTAVGTYELRVANILPGDAIEVELRYVELLTPSNGVYRFLLPNTFGMGRYADDLDASASTRKESDAAAVVQDAWFISATVSSAVPLAEVRSSSHKILSQRASPYRFEVLLDPAERRAATADFVLEYRLSGDEVQTGLALYERDGQGWFLWTMEPPLEVLPRNIPAREFVFVLDVSGSMNGKPLDTAKALMRDLAGVLRPTDFLNAITFAGGSQILERRSLPATQATVDRLLSFVDTARSGGGTELLPAMDRAFDLPDVGAMRTVVIVTDGAIGQTYDAADRIRLAHGQAGTFVFGVGQYLDTSTLTMLADAAQSQALLVAQEGASKQTLQDFRAYVDRPLLSDVQIEFDGMAVTQLQPASIPLLYAARPLTVAGRYTPPARGNLRVRGRSTLGDFERTVSVDAHRSDPNAEAIAFLWAQRAIDDLLISGRESNREQILQLGLEYALMTPYTAFVAVDQEVRNPEALSGTVQQPSPRRAAAPVTYGDLTQLGLPLLDRLDSGSLDSGMLRQRGSRSCQVIGGRAFSRQGEYWRSAGDRAVERADQTVVRIRPHSRAWQELLQAMPELRDWSALGDRVELDFGRWRLQIAADGFDHYPSATLDGLIQAYRSNRSSGSCLD